MRKSPDNIDINNLLNNNQERTLDVLSEKDEVDEGPEDPEKEYEEQIKELQLGIDNTEQCLSQVRRVRFELEAKILISKNTTRSRMS